MMPTSFSAKRIETDPLPFTEAELAALLRMLDTPEARRSVAALGLDRWTSVDEIRAVGFQSLLLRGLVSVQEGRYLAMGAADSIAMIAGHSDRVETAAFAGANVHTSLGLLHSAAGTLLLTITPLGVCELRPLQTGVGTLVVPRQVLETLISQPECEFPVEVHLVETTAEGQREVHGLVLAPEVWEHDGRRLNAEEFWAEAADGPQGLGLAQD